jgi:putative redox protein
MRIRERMTCITTSWTEGTSSRTIENDMTQTATARVDAREARYAQDIQTGRHVLVADEPEARGGSDAGPGPYEILLAALGACTSITLRMYAERKGWDVGRISVDLGFFKEGDADRIERTLRFGKVLSEEQRARLLEIAGKTPVTKTMMHGTSISTTLERAPG